MLSRPEGVEDGDVVRALADGWAFDSATIEYAAVGFGSYHWIATDPASAQRFVTVDVAEGERFVGLRRAFETSRTLRTKGLEFVVAPLPSIDGESVRRLGERHSIAVLPFVDGTTSAFGAFTERAAREGVLDLLIELHQATDGVRDTAPVVDVELAERPAITAAIVALDTRWNAGPYSEHTRAWLLVHAADVVTLVKRFDLLVKRVAAAGAERVITHGEPHPGNVLDTGDGLVLIDWDTVGLAIPERDLWLVADDVDERERYADATGHRPDRNALDLFALRWQLADIGIYLDLLRSPHVESADTAESWRNLDHSLQVALALV